MNNTEDAKKSKHQDGEAGGLKNGQGLTKTERNLRRRSSKVNYNLLDHGDSSDRSVDAGSVESHPDEIPKGKIKKKPSTKDRSQIPFIKKKSTNTIDEFAIHLGEDAPYDPKSDELDNPDIKQHPKPKKPKIIHESLDEPIEQVIDLNSLKTGPVSNSKLLLALIEVCMNAKNYGIKLQNKSRIFWDEVYSTKDFENIFKNFKAETLRKYWRILSDIGDIHQVITTIKAFEDIINQENAK
jgi:hypothetical protein